MGLSLLAFIILCINYVNNWNSDKWSFWRDEGHSYVYIQTELFINYLQLDLYPIGFSLIIVKLSWSSFIIWFGKIMNLWLDENNINIPLKIYNFLLMKFLFVLISTPPSGQTLGGLWFVNVISHYHLSYYQLGQLNQ